MFCTTVPNIKKKEILYACKNYIFKTIAKYISSSALKHK